MRSVERDTRRGLRGSFLGYNLFYLDRLRTFWRIGEYDYVQGAYRGIRFARGVYVR